MKFRFWPIPWNFTVKIIGPYSIAGEATDGTGFLMSRLQRYGVDLIPSWEEPAGTKNNNFRLKIVVFCLCARHA